MSFAINELAALLSAKTVESGVVVEVMDNGTVRVASRNGGLLVRTLDSSLATGDRVTIANDLAERVPVVRNVYAV